ncbi:phage tail protein [Streptomyces vinaceus]|uniref:phage tail protein n=1 Tax=Streptomyces vinaceus TaxID=1960 RepID=UPI003820B579
MSLRADMGLSARFVVSVDNISLGGWTNVKGLGINFESEELEVGGNYEHTVILPKRVKYTQVTLQRAMTAQGSAQIQAWLRSMIDAWYNCDEDKYPGATATITLLGPSADYARPIASWTLRNVYPKAWRGPDMDATSNKVATESLELVHQGFL